MIINVLEPDGEVNGLMEFSILSGVIARICKDESNTAEEMAELLATLALAVAKSEHAALLDTLNQAFELAFLQTEPYKLALKLYRQDADGETIGGDYLLARLREVADERAASETRRGSFEGLRETFQDRPEIDRQSLPKTHSPEVQEVMAELLATIWTSGYQEPQELFDAIEAWLARAETVSAGLRDRASQAGPEGSASDE